MVSDKGVYSGKILFDRGINSLEIHVLESRRVMVAQQRAMLTARGRQSMNSGLLSVLGVKLA